VKQAPSAVVSLRVLLVDDEPAVRDVLVLELEDLGFEVVAVDSGKRALAEVQRAPFDVVVTDYRMPGWDGLQTLLALKAHAPALPVVVATGCPTHALEVAVLGAGAFACLRKPFRFDELVSVLRRATKAA
jgi:DNA-binding NtrC family response regulator